MTEDFKKGLATGIAIGGVTVVKESIYGIKIGEYLMPPEGEPISYQAHALKVPIVITGEYTSNI